MECQRTVIPLEIFTRSAKFSENHFRTGCRIEELL